MALFIRTNASSTQLANSDRSAALQTALNRLSTGTRFVSSGGTVTGATVEFPYVFYVRDFPNSMLGADTATSGGSGVATAIVVTVTGDYTVPDTDYTVQVNPQVTTMTVTLPTAIGNDAGTIVVKDIQGIAAAGRVVTVAAQGGEYIDNVSSISLGDDDDQAVTLRSDGSNWRLI